MPLFGPVTEIGTNLYLAITQELLRFFWNVMYKKNPYILLSNQKI